MDFFDLDTMVPVYIDYLGTFERGVNGIETAPDAMKELVRIKQDQFTTSFKSPGGPFHREYENSVRNSHKNWYL